MKINKKYTLKLDFLYFNCETTKKKDFLFLKGSLRQKGPQKKKRERGRKVSRHSRVNSTELYVR